MVNKTVLFPMVLESVEIKTFEGSDEVIVRLNGNWEFAYKISTTCRARS